MNMKNNYSKEDFLRFWGKDGYVETFDGYRFNWTEDIKKIILGYIQNQVVLEIGCGAGYWTKILCEYSKKVYAIDLLPKSPFLSEKLHYIENDDLQFNCASVEDESIDFVFSFGTFCHMSIDACEEYLKDIIRVLKKDGKAIIMYADAEGLKKHWNDENAHGSSYFGEFINYDDIMPMVQKYDEKAKKILDINQGFRDCLVLINK